MNFVSLVSFPSLCKCTAKNRETPKKGRAIFLPVPDLLLRKAFPGERGGGQRVRKRVQKKGLTPPFDFVGAGSGYGKGYKKRACAPFDFVGAGSQSTEKATKKGFAPPFDFVGAGSQSTEKGTKKGLAPPFPESGTMVNPKATHRPPARLEPLVPRYPKSLLSTLCRTKMVSQIFLPLSFLFQIHLLEYHLCCL